MRIYRKPRKPYYATSLSRTLREESTPAEKLLWERLRNRIFMDLKFKRQKPIGRFILDFYCAAMKFGIEIDGPVHEKQKEYDAGRDAFLNGIGIKVIRVTNEDVALNIDGVLDKIKEHMANLRLNLGNSPLPLPGEGQG